ncbi:MAG: XRE family transcriptional regulator [Thermocaproicibacter melissae]|jgi:transcriptional regulator with XRE-family HTH domain|uniref:helix-turn-helix domain-containing protein n=1 Tax=Thermocaproicibacter melissae TaxID=2966552 RepID=UPI0024B2134D|nr:helix-turn-helix transcriptional regulator [Thermocaproicibacter melissae]WBY63577.1 helix-turn-helix transcriptional regulator [Thermocaproicibacter melissae]
MRTDKLKQYRIERGLTQAQFARLLGVSASAVGMYEQGRREPDGDLLARMASILHCTTDELLGVEPPHEVNEVIDNFTRTLEKQPGLMFHGTPMSDADREKLVNAIRVAAAIAAGKK